METAEYIVGDVFNLEFAQEFDLVICFGLLYHVSDPGALLDRLRELTSKSLCLSTIIMPSPLNHSFRYDSVEQRIRGGRYQRVWPQIYDWLTSVDFDESAPTAKWVDENVTRRGLQIETRKPFFTPAIHQLPLIRNLPSPQRWAPMGCRYSVRGTL